MRCSNVSRGQNGGATRGDGTKLMEAWGPPGEHMPSVAQTVASQLWPWMSWGKAGFTWPTPLNFFKEIWEFWRLHKSLLTCKCWLSLISLSFKYDVAKGARALLHNLCFGLSAGGHNFLPFSLNIPLPFHLQKGATGRPSLAPKKAWGLGTWGMHRDWILQRRAYNPKSSLLSRLQQNHVLTQDGPRQEGVNLEFLCGRTDWQPFLPGHWGPQVEIRTWERVKRAARK